MIKLVPKNIKYLPKRRQRIIASRKNILQLAIWGAVGCGIGYKLVDIVPWPARLIIPGAIGGISLGLTSKDWKRAGLLALAGAIGFGGGALLMAFFGFVFGEYLGGPVFYAVGGAIIGAVGGLSLCVALRNWAWLFFLILAGAVGFSIGSLLSYVILKSITSFLFGLIGGASIGAILGYLEKKKTNRGD